MRTLGCTNRTFNLGARDAKKQEIAYKFSAKFALTDNQVASDENKAYVTAASAGSEFLIDTDRRAHREAAHNNLLAYKNERTGSTVMDTRIKWVYTAEATESTNLLLAPFWDIIYSKSTTNRYVRWQCIRTSGGNTFAYQFAEINQGVGTVETKNLKTNEVIADGTALDTRVHIAAIGNRASCSMWNQVGTTDLSDSMDVVFGSELPVDVGTTAPFWYAQAGANKSNFGVEFVWVFYPW